MANVGGPFAGGHVRDSPGAQFAIGGRASLPLFELYGAQPVAEPLVEVLEDSGRLGQLEVELPTGEIAPQFRDDHRHAPASVAARDVSHSGLHFREGCRCDARSDHSPCGHPEAVAQELAFPRSCHRALGFVDL